MIRSVGRAAPSTWVFRSPLAALADVECVRYICIAKFAVAMAFAPGSAVRQPEGLFENAFAVVPARLADAIQPRPAPLLHDGAPLAGMPELAEGPILRDFASALKAVEPANQNMAAIGGAPFHCKGVGLIWIIFAWGIGRHPYPAVAADELDVRAPPIWRSAGRGLRSGWRG